MTENVREKLFTEFAPNTKQEWLDKVTADLKGADFAKKLVWRTKEGFDVQPMYRLEDIKELKNPANADSLPGEFPFIRGNHADSNDWLVRQDICVEDVAEANKKALDVLNKGVNSLGFCFHSDKSYTKADFLTLLAGIHVDCVEVNLVCDNHKFEIEKAYKEALLALGLDAQKIHGGININPLGCYLRHGKMCFATPETLPQVLKEKVDVMAQFPHFRSIEVDGYVFSNSGASIVQELAFTLAEGAQYIDLLTDAGLSVEAIVKKLRFRFGTSSKYFMEIAKLRAARYLWAHIVKAHYSATNQKADCDCAYKMHIHAETSEWNKTLYDANVNMLRTQTEAMSAALGGVDSFTVHPFDYAYETPTDLAERVARNQQLLLKEESHFAKIVDPAGGSYYIEELTEKIIEAAWKLFLEVQDAGGFLAAIKQGIVQKAVTEMAKTRDLDIATRRENFVGVNQFPNFNEVIDDDVIDDKSCACIFKAEDETAEGAEIETLKPYRGAQAFEALRYKTDQYTQKFGRPVVYMFPMGNLAMRKARAQFACNFFACAGFEVIDNNGFNSVDDGVRASIDHKADIVVLCSADDEYSTFAPQAYEQLKGRAIVVVAGNPETRPELEAAGLSNYIHVKNNILEELMNYQKQLKIA
ncbi:methylmalonyl-CoA mutase small subunit [Bacteroidia bacterium]|nr:methylmalonyl-CoA mutase small subunit [Bacteroidia bacterium]